MGYWKSGWWPRSPQDLADASKCPACFIPITAPVCPTCKLNLTDPRIRRLTELGQTMLTAQNQRDAFLRAIRESSAKKLAAAEAVAAERARIAQAAEAARSRANAPLADPGIRAPEPKVAPGIPMPAVPPPGEPVPAVPPPGAVPAAAAAAATQRSGLSVPVLLLVVGVSLVSIMAIFFLVLWWAVLDIAVRALIVGGVTLGTMVVASALRRRRLLATAEGIAVLGVVLLALDVWAVRATDLFGAGSAPPGVGIVVLAVVCRVWSVLSGLRSPDFVAVAAFPVGFGLLVAGVLDVGGTAALAVGLFGIAIAGLVHQLPAPFSTARADRDAVILRAVLAVVGIVALAGAFAAGCFSRLDVVGVPLLLTPLVIALATAHIAALKRAPVPGKPVLVGGCAAIAAVALGSLGWQLALRTDAPFVRECLAPVLAVAVAVGFSFVPRSAARAEWLRPARVAAWGVAGAGFLGSASGWFGRGLELSGRWDAWVTPAFGATAAFPIWTILAAITIAALLLVARAPEGSPTRLARAFVDSVILLLGAFTTGMPGPVVLAGITTAVMAIAVLRSSVRGPDAAARAETSGVRAGWIGTAVLGCGAAYAAGHANPWLWFLAAIVAITVPVVIARVLRPTGEALVGWALAPVAVASVAAVSAPGALAALSGRPSSAALATLALIHWLAVVVLALAWFTRAPNLVRRAWTVAGLALAAVGLVPLVLALLTAALPLGTGTIQGLLDSPVLGGVRVAAVLVLLGWTALRGSPATARAAAAVFPPTAALLVLVPISSAAVGFGAATVLPNRDAWLPTAALGAGVVIVVVGLVVVTFGAVVSVMGRPVNVATPDRAIGAPATSAAVGLPRVRGAADVSAGAMALIALWWVPAQSAWLGWAVLAAGFAAASAPAVWRRTPLTAPGANLAWMSAPGAAVVRRLLSWPAVASATWAWWAALDRFVPGASPDLRFVVPALALVGFCAALVWLRRTAEAAIALVVALILGLVLPLLGDGVGARAAVSIVVGAAVAIALAGTPLRRIRHVAVEGWTTGIVISLALAVLRPWGAAAESIWLLVPVAAAYLVALGASAAERTAKPSPTALSTLLAPVTLAVAASVAVLVQGALGAQLISLVATSALAADAVVRYLRRAVWAWPVVAAAGALFALGAPTVAGVQPVELFTAPAAVGLLIVGAHRLRANRAVRSWPALGAGLALVTVPSLMYDLGPTAVWRIVALGFVAFALVVVGAVRRLQAPLVLGSGVLLVHGVAQLWPWIVASYTAVPWWLWAGLAGVLLIVIALRYERQKVALRRAFEAVAALR